MATTDPTAVQAPPPEPAAPSTQVSPASASPCYLEPPSKYTSSKNPQRTLKTPSLEWLSRTWTVTHSTLSMWKSARNVRITYTPLTTSSPNKVQIDDLVEYEPSSSSNKLKTVRGVDTQCADDPTNWDWRGRSWLFFVTSHWEILGWGEVKDEITGEVKERWVVTWFAPTVFTKEGVDFYSDRREGMSEGLYGGLMDALKGLSKLKGLEFEETSDWQKMVGEDMAAVEIKLPWVEK